MTINSLLGLRFVVAITMEIFSYAESAQSDEELRSIFRSGSEQLS